MFVARSNCVSVGQERSPKSAPQLTLTVKYKPEKKQLGNLLFLSQNHGYE
ncbi:hypothetical protein SAMN05444285_102220 [Draconibacterium orientale]|uniref:Uncharacterized protein n=1 Tax=Draconibacterium orientale TaxID=1168034 RepID=A0A1H9ZQ15_9BACT|nr:hypothetical protein SAMN05444285_102220 [Draconibacterium orientale]